MPRLPRTAGLAALALVLAGCTSGDGDPSPPAADPTPLGEYDATGLSLSREGPCSRLATDAVARVLGGEVTDTTTYASGEKASLAPGVRDVTQEAGCSFRGEEAVVARAWTFDPPVAPARARSFVRTLGGEARCQRVADAPAFGKPGLGRVCGRGKRTVGSFGGLFGEAWLGCSVEVPRSAARGEQGRDALLRRTGEWCAQVVEAARQVTEEGPAEG